MPAFDPRLSKLKMVILTKHGHDNETWWSLINQNRWNNHRIIKGMLKRFCKNRLCLITNKVQWYENGILVYEHTITPSDYAKNNGNKSKA